MKKILLLLLLFAGVNIAQVNGVSWQSVTIDSGSTASSTLDLQGKNLKIVGIAIDSTNWTSANLTIKSYNPKNQKWGKVQDTDDAVYTITIGTMSEPIEVYLLPANLAGFEKIKFISSATQTGGDITIYVKVRPY